MVRILLSLSVALTASLVSAGVYQHIDSSSINQGKKKSQAEAAEKRTVLKTDGEEDFEREQKQEEQYFSKSSVLVLNKYIFDENVLESSDNGVQHWIVFFCVSWWEGCQGMEAPYKALASQWHDELNTDLMMNEVRFAAVDCAVDKVLCNQQGVDDYPTVGHYHQHRPISAWSDRSGLKKMTQKLGKWLEVRLGHLRVGRVDADEEITAPQAPQTMLEQAKAAMPDGALDFMVLILAILGNAWVVSRSVTPSPAKKASTAKEPASSAASPAQTSISRLLPEEWAKERTSIEL